MSAETRWLCATWFMLGLGMPWESSVTTLLFTMGGFACWTMAWVKEWPK